MTRQYIAVDLGAESGRTIVASFDGQRFQLSETHRFPNGYVRVLDTMHWDIVRLWQEIKTGIGKSLHQAGPAISVGIDTWGVDYGLVADDGSLVGNPVHYRDPRTAGIYDYAFNIVPKDEIYRRTGLQFLPFNTLFQLVAAQRKRGKKAFEGVSKMLLIPDLLNSFLTGEQVAEYTIASTTQMLDARTQKWDVELIEKFGLPASLLPPLVKTGTRLGKVRADVADDIGGVTEVIASAGHDTAAAVAAVPASAGDDWCYISSGTWSLMGAELSAPSISEQTLADNFTNEGGVGGTIRFLKNIMGLWLVQQCRRSFEKSGATIDYAELTNKAAAAPAFQAIIDPDDLSFMNPPDMPAAIKAFCEKHKQPAPADSASVVRTCLEGLALRYRKTKEELELNMGRKINRIHIVGGGSQNKLLSQLTADCCQAEVIAGPIEATALGNVLVQALSSGDIGTLEEGREIIKNSFPAEKYEPVSSSEAAWDDQYGKFKSLLT